MWTSSPVHSSMRILEQCLSPISRTQPTILVTARLRAYVSLIENHAIGSRYFSVNKCRMTGRKRFFSFVHTWTIFSSLFFTDWTSCIAFKKSWEVMSLGWYLKMVSSTVFRFVQYTHFSWAGGKYLMRGFVPTTNSITPVASGRANTPYVLYRSFLERVSRFRLRRSLTRTNICSITASCRNPSSFLNYAKRISLA